MLVVYIVDKDGGKNEKTGQTDFYADGKNFKRFSLFELNLPTHLVGYYIYIPYGKCNDDVTYLQIKLKNDNTSLEETDIDEIPD